MKGRCLPVAHEDDKREGVTQYEFSDPAKGEKDAAEEDTYSNI